MCKYVLAIDPSGNFDEGTGVTGWVLLYNPEPGTIKCIKHGVIDASTSLTKEEHWGKHMSLISGLTETLGEKPMVVVEDFMLYSNRAQEQINSRFETPKLIGCIQYYCYKHGYKYHMQTAASVKRRWTNDILEHKGFISQKTFVRMGKPYKVVNFGEYKVPDHVVDALRHGVHFCTFHMYKEGK